MTTVAAPSENAATFADAARALIEGARHALARGDREAAARLLDVVDKLIGRMVDVMPGERRLP